MSNRLRRKSMSRPSQLGGKRGHLGVREAQNGEEKCSSESMSHPHYCLREQPSPTPPSTQWATKSRLHAPQCVGLERNGQVSLVLVPRGWTINLVNGNLSARFLYLTIETMRALVMEFGRQLSVAKHRSLRESKVHSQHQQLHCPHNLRN